MQSKKLQITVPRPDTTIEQTRRAWFEDENECHGRGSKTAAARGYNIEFLTERVFQALGPHYPYEDVSIFDKSKSLDEGHLLIETKSCVNRYSNGSLGCFRIWKKNHSELLTAEHPIFADSIGDSDIPHKRVYFFVVYRLERGIPAYTDSFDEKLLPFEVGKIVVDVETVNRIIRDRFFEIDHSSMGKTKVADISWKMLLNELEISPEVFKNQDMFIEPDYLTR